MIDEENTFELFGYYSYDLKSKSNKKIVCICNGCGKERVLDKSGYSDLCKSCSKKGENHHMYGKHHSKEAREKMSKARDGKHHSIETKEKLSKAVSGAKNPMYGRKGKDNPNFGSHRSFETLEKMSKALKGKYCGENSSFFGKHHTNEFKEKLSKDRKGKNNPNYIDGKCEVRDSARRRNFPKPKFYLGDNYCKEEKNVFVAHHLTKEVIIYIPEYIHRKNRHRLKSVKSVKEINNLSLKFLLEGF